MNDNVETAGSLKTSQSGYGQCWIGEMPGNSLYVGFLNKANLPDVSLLHS